MMLLEYNDKSIATKENKTSDFLESIFFQGNGYMGCRGFSCEDSSFRPHQKGLYMAGVFDQLKPGITDIVNTPNFFPITLKVGSELLEDAEITDFYQMIDISCGLLIRKYIAVFGKKRVSVVISRFLSLSDVHTACVRLELIPLNFEGEITVTASLDASSCNLPVNDDQVKKNNETVKYLDLIFSNPREKGGSMLLKTKVTEIAIFQAFELSSSENVKVLKRRHESSENRLDYCVSFSANPKEHYVFDKLITVFTSREVSEDKIESIALNRLNCITETGYVELLEESRSKWSKRWETADIRIIGDIKAQCAVRYNVYQLICNNARGDELVSIGARGLTHARYKGCYFWDTDIFMLPFFVYTDPAAAKNLLLYRYHTLDAARQHALKMSAGGARYPWMASYDGSEQCESWDIGACEVHVTCDVVYAMDQYIKISGDTQFLVGYAAEIYLETARFWASRFTYDRNKDQFNMLFVKGPDEYCGSTQNNTYTNILAVHNLNLALETLSLLQKQHSEVYKALVKKLDIKGEELTIWREISQKAAIPYDSGKDLFLQDDTFMLLEPLDIQDHKTDNTPLYHKICFDRLQRYRVLKQADLVLLMALMPQRFTFAQKKAVWDFYEPLTLHDSTLSYGIHALLAAQLEENEKAWDYLNKSLYLDLGNIMSNTGSEGIHMAALGATWQALILGFAGLSFEGDTPKVSPNLPQGWEEMSFTIHFKGKRLKITINKNGSEIATIG